MEIQKGFSMNNNIVKTQEEWLSKEDLEIVKSQFFPITATENEIKYCLSVAKAFNLNPILKQIFFIQRGGYQSQGQGKKDIWVEKTEPLAGRDSFLTLAHRSGAFESIESFTEIREVPKLENKKWVNTSELVGIAKVFKKGNDKPFTVEVIYSEYVQYKKDKITPTQMWTNKPHTMIKKVAESQCLRKAFDITGLYDEFEYSTVQKSNDEAIETVPTNDTTKKDLNTLSIDGVAKVNNNYTIDDITLLWEDSKPEKRKEMLPYLAKGWKEYNQEQINELFESVSKL